MMLDPIQKFEPAPNPGQFSLPREQIATQHSVADAQGRPIMLFVMAGRVGDYSGAAALLLGFPKASRILADRDYDVERLREPLKRKDIKA